MIKMLAMALIAAQAASPATKPEVGTPASIVARAKLDRSQVLLAVRSEWPRHDADGKGRLTPLEFSTWVMQANGATVAPAGLPRSNAKGMAPTSAMNAAATAFARADANHDGGVTPDEMASFLMASPAAIQARQTTSPAPTIVAPHGH